LDTITIARIILDLYATKDGGFTASTAGVQKIEMGICVVTEAAFDAGQASIPDPRVAADFPARGWLWRGLMLVQWHNLNSIENETPYLIGHVQADLGAMRRLDKGRLVLISSKTAIDGTEIDYNVNGLIRVLCLT